MYKEFFTFVLDKPVPKFLRDGIALRCTNLSVPDN